MAMMRKVKQMDTIKLIELMIFLVMFIIAVGLIIAAGVLSSSGNTKYTPTDNIKFSTAKPSILPLQDTDHDSLSNIAENYIYGTNESNPDTDGDGMPDGWEVRYGTRDPVTHKYNIDPNDPSDAYVDADNDGYDFNHNGKLDAYYDDIVLSKLHIPKQVDYTDVTINNLIQNIGQYSQPGHNLVRLEVAQVTDNGSFKEGLGREVTFKMSKTSDYVCAMTITVADLTSMQPLEVCVEAGGNRPFKLSDKDTYVDIQGVFRIVENLKPQIVVRGGEQYNNLMEYQYRGLTGNDTNPVNPDTDKDQMYDGWEVAYGRGYMNTTLNPPRWTWIYHIDPTWNGDWNLDPDNDAIMYADKLLGNNLDEYHWGTDPTQGDSDHDSYDPIHPDQAKNCIDSAEFLIYHTDPNNWDTDGDGMSDGWEIYYGLNATNPTDKYQDPDKDGLANIDEFLAGTNPRKWDTDGDGMPDGWEVKYGLNPQNPADALMDSDVDKTGRAKPDLLINLFEYYNNTDPTSPDTDGDHLGDYEEVVVGQEVKVNHHWEHYRTCATSVDTDHDNKPRDLDGDNDFSADEDLVNGITGQIIDNDNDGVDPAHVELNTNDYNEVYAGCRGYVTNASNPDTDGDGIDDWTEIFTDRDPTQTGIQSTDPTLEDTDGDGLKDGQEILGVYAWMPGRQVKTLLKTNPLKQDSDNDGLSDGKEVLTDFDHQTWEKGNPAIKQLKDPLTGLIIAYDAVYSTGVGVVNSSDPGNPDTNGNGIPDGYEYDYSDLDHDGMPTWWEEQYGLGRLDPTKLDTDGNGNIDSEEDFDLDGFDNLQEFIHRADPNNPYTFQTGLFDSKVTYTDPYGRPLMLRMPVYDSTNGDHIPDWWKNYYGLSTTLNMTLQDLDTDGFRNIDEYLYNTGPSTPNPNDWFDHAITYSPYAADSNDKGLADWWQHYYWGDDWEKKCDPVANDDGPPDHVNGDNWTNAQEWQSKTFDDTRNVYRTVPVFQFQDPFTGRKYNGNDSNNNTINDDIDPVPMDIPILPAPHPMNPVDIGPSLNPIMSGGERADSDNDGMNNLEEFRRPLGQTNPTDPDSDEDAMPDGWEWGHGMYNNDTRTLNPDPLISDAYTDADMEGINYSRKWIDTNGDNKKDTNESWDIHGLDFNGDGLLDPLLENESFGNLKEYYMGIDINADGFNEITYDPNNNCTYCTEKDKIEDGFRWAFSDNDLDGLPNWFEIVFGLDPNNPYADNGSAGDWDHDGFTNKQEYKARPWPTAPRNPNSYPGRSIAGDKDYGTGSRAESDTNSLLDWNALEQRMAPTTIYPYGQVGGTTGRPQSR